MIVGGPSFEEARAQYRPSRVRILFVAESPPRAGSNRFFYFEDVDRGDSLFVEMMKALYPLDVPPTPVLRSRKQEFLKRFQGDDYYLIDASPTPIGDRTKKQAIMEGLPSLLASIREVADETTRIVLLTATVYEVALPYLRAHGIRVANSEMINFPGSGQQANFHRKIKALLGSFS